MSGSGGGGYGGGGSSETSCADLVFETQLSSPKADVIEGLAPGDVLSVELVQQGSIYAIVAIRGDQTAGGLASPDVQRLRECLLKGVTYDATVLTVRDGQVKIRVHARV